MPLDTAALGCCLRGNREARFAANSLSESTGSIVARTVPHVATSSNTCAGTHCGSSSIPLGVCILPIVASMFLPLVKYEAS